MNRNPRGTEEEEEKLLYQKLMFQSLFDSSPDAIAILDDSDRVVEINPAFEALFNYTPLEAKGQLINDLIAPPPYNTEASCFSNQVVKKSLSIEKESYRYRKDGTPVDVYVVGFPVKIDNKTIGIFAVYRDLTAKKNAEAEKFKLQSQLSQAQKMESVGRLAGGVAHDFNNMLSVILGHAELLMEKFDNEEPDYHSLNEIYKAAKRSADLTRQLLAFARKQTISPKVIDLNSTVAGMLTMVKRLIGENVELAWLPDSTEAKIFIDPSQIDQIVTNLCVNARDAITDSGKITVETGRADIDKDYCDDHAGFIPGHYATLTVSDNGCGMDREILTNAFEPFFTANKKGINTGLGLSTVYGIVKQNKGFINIYSEPGAGTTIKIYLPIYEGAGSPGSDRLLEKQILKSGTETILLVEDEPALIELTRAMLERCGYTVIASKSPAEALKKAEDNRSRIKLLITDVVMPEMNGYNLAKKLQADNPDLKCLYMSGYTSNIIASHGVLDKDVNFIQKPFSIKDLSAKVRSVLSE